MGVPHWETLREYLLPNMEKMAPGLIASYDDFVNTEGLPDFYALQKTELCHKLAVGSGCDIAKASGNDQLTQMAYSSWRTAMEECYAVGYFERFGCRVIEPTLNLVNMMLNTEVSWELGKIRPPCPHMYFELPKGHDIKSRAYKSGEDRLVDGFYVTWSRVTEATREAEKELGDKPFKRIHGLTVYPKTEDGYELVEDAEDDETAPKGKDAFGDWACRIMAIQRDSHKQHDWSVHFFNLHWEEDCSDIAEGHLRRFQKLWDRSPYTTGRHNIDMQLYEKLFHLAANIFLYMSHPGKHDVMWMPSELRERLRERRKQLSSKQRRSLKRRIRDERPIEAYVVGRKVVVDPAIESVNNTAFISGDRQSPEAHPVRAHWRGQWRGSEKNGTRELIAKWIEGYKRGVGIIPRHTKYVVKA